jgi:hypothetical protein
VNSRVCTLTFTLVVLGVYQYLAIRAQKKTDGFDLFHIGVAALGVTAALRIVFFAYEVATIEAGKLTGVGLLGIGEDDYLFVAIGGLSLGKLSIAQLRDHFVAVRRPKPAAGAPPAPPADQFHR